MSAAGLGAAGIGAGIETGLGLGSISGGGTLNSDSLEASQNKAMMGGEETKLGKSGMSDYSKMVQHYQRDSMKPIG